MNLAVVSVFISSMVVTAYQSRPSQTDSTPYRTSINERVNGSGVAAHPSLLCRQAKISTGRATFRLCHRDAGCPDKNKLHYGDVIYIEGVGTKIVNDVMANKTKLGAKLDVWVPTNDAEREHYKKFGIRKLRIWLIKIKETNAH